ncbi:hypothetical protein MLD38_026606 [Melastoma candidum]|uniref:Uncharacterized protein n=1 Tax=Melastoma candidum TaxID=119954 RepID=A0ACB9NZ57_9MYRT|nr:hypothetical protein MLD38_026606 [Melastoma candidum]
MISGHVEVGLVSKYDRRHSFLPRCHVAPVACLVSDFIDPLFLYLPRASRYACIRSSVFLEVVLAVISFVVDMFYVIWIFVRFRTAYVAPSTRVFGRGELIIGHSKIATRYMCMSFWLEFLFRRCTIKHISNRHLQYWDHLGISCRSSGRKSADDNNVMKGIRTATKYPANATRRLLQVWDLHRRGDPRSNGRKVLEQVFLLALVGTEESKSLGQNLITSTFVGEILFTIVITTLGRVLFGLLIGNVPTYLQLTTMQLEE